MQAKTDEICIHLNLERRMISRISLQNHVGYITYLSSVSCTSNKSETAGRHDGFSTYSRTANENGRYLDVLVEWREFGQFAVEYQMSHSFQTEVLQRCIHYEREGFSLLWILSSFDLEKIPQAVPGVVHHHRRNYFVLDQAAVSASRKQMTLVLSCYLSNGHGYDALILTRFDQLVFPENHAFF